MATGIVALVSAISDAVVASLEEAELPELSEGKILLGRQHQYGEAMPPRIIFIPLGSKFGPRNITSAAPVATNLSGPDAERLAMLHQPAIGTEKVRFEVRCWGQSEDEDADEDFDCTQTLYRKVVLCVHKLCLGVYDLGDLTWTDSQIANPQHVRAGREAVFTLTIDTPVLDDTIGTAPSNTRPVPTTHMTSADGTATNLGCG